MDFTVLQEMSLQGYFICAALFIGFVWVITLLHGIKSAIEDIRLLTDDQENPRLQSTRTRTGKPRYGNRHPEAAEAQQRDDG